jgi:hypothetical protein
MTIPLVTPLIHTAQSMARRDSNRRLALSAFGNIPIEPIEDRYQQFLKDTGLKAIREGALHDKSSHALLRLGIDPFTEFKAITTQAGVVRASRGGRIPDTASELLQEPHYGNVAHTLEEVRDSIITTIDPRVAPGLTVPHVTDEDLAEHMAQLQAVIPKVAEQLKMPLAHGPAEDEMPSNHDAFVRMLGDVFVPKDLGR